LQIYGAGNHGDYDNLPKHSLEVHHQGTEADDSALPLYPMAKWRLSSRSLTSIRRLFLSAKRRSSPSRRPLVVRPQRCGQC
jgi:hypothetical protein